MTKQYNSYTASSIPEPTDQSILRIPFCFMTNGGGRTEEDFALSLQSKLNVPIMGSQVIESHTHFKRLLPEYQNKKVLVYIITYLLSLSVDLGTSQLLECSPSLRL